MTAQSAAKHAPYRQRRVKLMQHLAAEGIIEQKPSRKMIERGNRFLKP